MAHWAGGNRKMAWFARRRSSIFRGLHGAETTAEEVDAHVIHALEIWQAAPNKGRHNVSNPFEPARHKE